MSRPFADEVDRYQSVPCKWAVASTSCLQNVPGFSSPNWGRGLEKPAQRPHIALGTTFCLIGTKARHEAPTFGTSLFNLDPCCRWPSAYLYGRAMGEVTHNVCEAVSFWSNGTNGGGVAGGEGYRASVTCLARAAICLPLSRPQGEPEGSTDLCVAFV